MSTTVLAPSGLEVTSNHESAEVMLESLAKPSEEKTPRLLKDKGKAVEEKPEEDEKDEHAVALGKKGGEAAAAKRKAEAKEKEPEKDAKADKEAKEPAQAKGKAETEDKDKKGNPRHDPEARIAVIAREKREAQERAERAERRLAEIERERQRPAPPVQAQPRPAAPQEDAEPQEGDFETYPEFVKASARYAARQERKAAEAEQVQRARAHERATRIGSHVDAFKDRVAKAAEADESFMQRTAALARALQPSFTLPKGRQPGPIHVLTDEIITSERATALMEHFAGNPSDFQRIASLRTPREISREVAKLEDRLEAVTADTSSRREVSKAGSPVRSVAGSPHAAEPDLTADMDFNRFMSLKRARNS